MASDLFNEAFAAARKRGDKEFSFAGKKYHTRTKEEDAARKADSKPSATPDARQSEPISSSDAEDANGLYTPGKSTPVRKPDPGTSKAKAAERAGKDYESQPGKGINQGYAKGGSVRGVGAALRGYGKGKLT